MRTILILMDSLNRNYLNVYGQSFVKTPNIDKLAEQSLVFENHYSCSLPCIPARRELMTGKVNFLESPWGAIEPWDICLPTLLREQSTVYSHMITDHYHYFHNSGEGYHTLFDSYEFVRGQEADKWQPIIKVDKPNYIGNDNHAYWANRSTLDLEDEEQYPSIKCINKAIEFIEINKSIDNWHLHLELFDPHEPFTCPKKYRDMYNDEWGQDVVLEWPKYKSLAQNNLNEEEINHIRSSYAGILTMIDKKLGVLFDTLDKYNIWEDTAVILTTDHGHLLGEQGYFGKNYMYDYQQLIHIPLLMHLPNKSSKKIDKLTSTIDIMPTIMELHNAQCGKYVHGKSLCQLFEGDNKVHDEIMFGYFGKDIGLFDGKYKYVRSPKDASKLYQYTALPTNYTGPYDSKVLRTAQMGVFLENTFGIPHYRIEHESYQHADYDNRNCIYDIDTDEDEKYNIINESLEEKLKKKLVKLMKEYEAPICQFQRFNLDKN